MSRSQIVEKSSGILGFSLWRPTVQQQQQHTHKHTQWQNKRSPSSAVARQAEPSAAVTATLSWSAACLTTSFTRHLLAVNHTRETSVCAYVCVRVSWGYWWNCQGQDETCQSLPLYLFFCLLLFYPIHPSVHLTFRECPWSLCVAISISNSCT